MLRSRRSARSRRDGERGQILVIVAGGIIGLLAIAAFTLEGGTMILNRRDAQNAADIASLAGAHIVALHYTDGGRTGADVENAISGSLDVNNCEAGVGTPCSWEANYVGASFTDLGPVAAGSIPSNAIGVRVGVTREPPTFLGRIPPMSQDHWTVATEATAITGKSPQIGSGTLLPIAMCGFGTNGVNDCEQANGSNAIDFVPGQIYDITDGKDAPGGFGWLSWTGSNSAPALESSLCNPDNPPFTLDSLTDPPGDWLKGDVLGTNPADGETWFPAGNGKMNSSGVRACLDGYITRGDTVLIPIYDIQNSKPNGDNLAYHIVGIAAFVLTAREQPAVDQIQGHFVAYYDLTNVPGGAGWTPPSPDDTTTFIGLVK
jgi:hypothetical protein